MKRFLESFAGSFLGIVLAVLAVRFVESPPNSLVLVSDDGGTEFEITAMSGTVWTTTRIDGKSFKNVLWDDRHGSPLPRIGDDFGSGTPPGTFEPRHVSHNSH